MDIEIGVVGKPNRWVLNQSRIHIGRDSKCEVCLPAGQFPSVSGEHLVLDVSGGAVRVSNAVGLGGETYLNERLAGPGTAIRSGDVLRLGAMGPELRIRLLERESSLPAADYEQTRVLHEATREISGPGETTVMPGPASPAGSPRRHGYETVAVPAIPARPDAHFPPSASPRRPDSPANAGGVPVGYGPVQGPAARIPSPTPAVQPAAAKEDGGVNLRSLENKLNVMRYILAANLVVLLALLAWLFQLNRQLGQTQDELREMHAQAQTAVSQFTPALDARIDTFEKRMDGMDAKMQAAEDRLVNRMNAEIPAMLDKYINKKMAESKLKP